MNHSDNEKKHESNDSSTRIPIVIIVAVISLFFLIMFVAFNGQGENKRGIVISNSIGLSTYLKERCERFEYLQNKIQQDYDFDFTSNSDDSFQKSILMNEMIEVRKDYIDAYLMAQRFVLKEDSSIQRDLDNRCANTDVIDIIADKNASNISYIFHYQRINNSLL